ncbi:MAG: GNAT family N-acetyltransferase [Bacteroidota bacterium]
MRIYLLETARLGLRTWLASDLDPFAEMNQDPRVMEFFPRTFTYEESKKGIDTFNQHYEEHGFTYYAVDRLDSSDFIGFIGIKHQTFDSHFTPCIDIGWRLAVDAWGKGFATEGAKACLDHAFRQLNLSEIYSTTPLLNTPSKRVMQKIGMQFAGEFDHPKIPVDSPLNRCCLYKAGRSDYM